VIHPTIERQAEAVKHAADGGYESQTVAEMEAEADALSAAHASLHALPGLVAVLQLLVDEFGGTLDLYNRNGPDFTFKDGTQVFDVSVIVDRAEIIESARAALRALAARKWE
jgi:hypothetical protein